MPNAMYWSVEDNKKKPVKRSCTITLSLGEQDCQVYTLFSYIHSGVLQVCTRCDHQNIMNLVISDGIQVLVLEI